MSAHPSETKANTWEDIGRGAAAELRTRPQTISHIKARGFVCHELVHLLGGRIEFVETQWKSFVLKALERWFPVAPICQWTPPANGDLARVGYRAQEETVVYRYTPESGAVVVFFVNYRPEPPAWGGYIRSLFKMPQLDLRKFLRPPFDKSNEDLRLARVLRSGIVQQFAPIPIDEAAREHMSEIDLEIRRALWEEFSK